MSAWLAGGEGPRIHVFTLEVKRDVTGPQDASGAAVSASLRVKHRILLSGVKKFLIKMDVTGHLVASGAVVGASLRVPTRTKSKILSLRKSLFSNLSRDSDDDDKEDVDSDATEYTLAVIDFKFTC